MGDLSHNYAAHAADDLRKIASHSRDPELAVLAKNLAAAIVAMPKFSLPDSGDILGWQQSHRGTPIIGLLKTYAQPFRLPFPVCVLEFRAPLTVAGDEMDWDASVVIATEGEESGLRFVTVTPVSRMLLDGRRIWMPCNFSVKVYEDGAFTCKAITNSGEEHFASLGDPERIALAASDTQLEVQAVVQMIAALACSNVGMSQTQAPAAINKKRARNGKTPFFSYHILEIAPSGATGSGGGLHASPRMHLRRGHIRRLEHKSVWVNSCVVGDSRMGVAAKDYSVPARPRLSTTQVETAAKPGDSAA